ncbi:hypothetical protein Peur_073172 [Populus x canadensis]
MGPSFNIHITDGKDTRSTARNEATKCPPLIVATKGPSLSSTSGIARELADPYKHPLIDEDDITKALKSIHPTSSSRTKVSNEHFRTLIFGVLYNVASAQLNRQISMTINTTLSDRAYLDRLA